jgi:hypothetical protein
MTPAGGNSEKGKKAFLEKVLNVTANAYARPLKANGTILLEIQHVF